jgi:putative (di)nucleoside polyphosphate hydrolase|tara:strand:+ start:1283 stop:2017 length:735 start_codon:yes stop_codon:yes gene_type:complete
MLAAASRVCLSTRCRAFAKFVSARRAMAGSYVPPHLRADAGRGVSTPAMASAKLGKNGERVYPAEGRVEVGGKWYRRCAAALVFNKHGEVLLGERLDRPGSWGMPQGGVEIDETTDAAAVRELYEEVGMKVGVDGLEFVATVPCEPSAAFCYEAGGWLAGQGLAGQRLEFTLFHLPTVDDANEFVDLKGLQGEKPEFSRVKWAPIAEAVEQAWGPKKIPYRRCAELAAPIIKKHLSGSRGEEGE